MHSKIFLLLGASSWLASAMDAPMTSGNDPKITYKATLPAKNTTKIRGVISGRGDPSGTGIFFKIKFEGIPSEGGPFIYHIHSSPLSPDGNCTSALAHLDPYLRGETPLCDSSAPQTCQVGDLSGKHGNITSAGTFETSYTDPFVSSIPGSEGFFGNRSIVIHNRDKKRLTCANFRVHVGNMSSASTSAGTMTATMVPGAAGTGAAGAGNMTGSVMSPTASVTTTTGVATVPTGGAAVRGVGAVAVLLGGMALLL